MDENGGSFVEVRRISQGPDRGSVYHSTPVDDLTFLQEECLHRLQYRIDVSYDSSKREHQEALRGLWYAAYPGIELHDLISEQWKDMGWQGKDPSTDFR
ncbi:hypothetical protein GW17_00002027 [Ensete ventricosum]|nr:hypothetical protein GW17_00002027 [Ensete ventricosum]RZS02138.1 hypothetical protein BHM03_00032140 [Ensete ventricosum]